jgi:hypothetical protein
MALVPPSCVHSACGRLEVPALLLWCLHWDAVLCIAPAFVFPALEYVFLFTPTFVCAVSHGLTLGISDMVLNTRLTPWCEQHSTLVYCIITVMMQYTSGSAAHMTLLAALPLHKEAPEGGISCAPCSNFHSHCVCSASTVQAARMQCGLYSSIKPDWQSGRDTWQAWYKRHIFLHWVVSNACMW